MSKFRMMAAGLAAACFLTTMSGCMAANRTPQGTTTPGTLTPQGLNQNLARGVTPNTVIPGTGSNLTTYPGTTTVIPGTGSNLTTYPGTTTTPGRINLTPLTFDIQKADHIVRNIGKVDGIRNIKAVVNGNTALVGYTPSGTMRNTLATKNAIVAKVKSLDRSITNVVVTDSADLTNKITKLSNDIKSNKVGTSLNNTFNQLVKKVK